MSYPNISAQLWHDTREFLEINWDVSDHYLGAGIEFLSNVIFCIGGSVRGGGGWDAAGVSCVS